MSLHRVLTFLIVCVCVTPLLIGPIGINQGIYAYLGQTILEGGVIYRDAVDHKGPSVYYLYAAWIALFGKSSVAIGGLAATLVGLGAWLASYVAERLAGKWAAPACAFVYAIVVQVPFMTDDLVSTSLWFAEGEDLELIAGMSLALLIGGRKWTTPRIVGAALALGIAASGKQITVVSLTLSFFTGALLCWRHGQLPTLKQVGLFFAVAFTPWILYLAYFAAQGALHPLYDMMIAWQLSGYSKLIKVGPDYTVGTLFYNRLYPIVFGAVLSAPLFWWLARKADADRGDKVRQATALMIVASLIGGLISVFIQSHGWGYHWKSVVGPGSVIITSCAVLAISRYAVPRGAVVRWAAIAVALGLMVMVSRATSRPYRMSWAAVAKVATGASTVAQEIGKMGDPVGRFQDEQDAIDFIKSTTTSTETIMVYALHSGIHLMSDRKPSGRFCLTMQTAWVSARRAEYREEFVRRDLSSPRPRYVVFTDNPGPAPNPFGQFMTKSLSMLPDFPELDTLMRTEYRLARRFGPWVVYEHLPSARPVELGVPTDGG